MRAPGGVSGAAAPASLMLTLTASAGRCAVSVALLCGGSATVPFSVQWEGKADASSKPE